MTCVCLGRQHTSGDAGYQEELCHGDQKNPQNGFARNQQVAWSLLADRSVVLFGKYASHVVPRPDAFYCSAGAAGLHILRLFDRRTLSVEQRSDLER